MSAAPPPAVPDPIRSAAVVAKLYVLAAIDEAILELARIRTRYTADLSGDAPFALLLAADERLRGRSGFDGNASAYAEAMRRIELVAAAAPRAARDGAR